MKPILKVLGTGALAIALLTACSNDTRKEQTQEQENNPDVEQGEQNNTEQGEVTKIKPEDFGAALLEEKFADIYAQTSAEFQQQVPQDQLISLLSSFTQGVNGYELLAEIPSGSLIEYLWTDDSGEKGIRAVFGEELTIEGLQLVPLTAFPETDQVYTETSFIMPTTKTWYTFWGGTNELVNYHYAVESQRYAYDLVIAKDGVSYEGEPTQNESYFAFGQEVIAPAGGTVISVENEIKDNTPLLETNVNEPLGNHVIIDHGNGEYSVLAHFQQGSIVVAEGDVVGQGELLGLCGNSGNSSEPHIHFHVIDSEDGMSGTSIRIKFENGVEPVRGEEVPAGK